MIFKIINFLMLFLPYGLVIHLHKYNRALPANIRTNSGTLLKAVMITNNYGIIFTEKDYIKNRVKFLREQQDKLNGAYQQIAKEMNSLSMQAREYFFEESNEHSNNR